MALTTEHEREVNASTHYLACFRGTNLRRTIIVIGCYCMQVLGGSTLWAYSTYFFEQAGLPIDQAFNMSIFAYGLGLAGVLVAVSQYRWQCDHTIPAKPISWGGEEGGGRGAKSRFFWGGTCILGLLFTWFFIPEPKDRTTAELDLLFERKVPAQTFVKTRVHLSEVTGENRVA